MTEGEEKTHMFGLFFKPGESLANLQTSVLTGAAAKKQARWEKY